MSPVRMAKVESAARIALTFVESFNRGDSRTISTLLSEDCVLEYHSPPPEGRIVEGREGVTRFVQDMMLGSPDLRFEIEDLKGLGYRCDLTWRMVDPGNGYQIRGIFVPETIDDKMTRIRSHARDRPYKIPAGNNSPNKLSLPCFYSNHVKKSCF